MTTVSVVIPTYNDGDTVGRAIRSVQKQTYRDVEIIVVNDASTDATAQAVGEFSDDRIQYTEHETNRGGSAARNTGIELATGEYVAFLDADDEWNPQKIDKQLEELQSRSDDWVAVHCKRKRKMGVADKIGYELSKLIGTRDEEPTREGGEELIKEILLTNLSTGASTLLVRSDVVDRIGGFDSEFPRHQDWEFLIRVLQQGKLAHVDEQLVVKHGTGRPSADVHEEAKDLLLSKFSREIDRLEKEGDPVTFTQRLHLAKLYFEDGEFRTGWEKLPRSSLGVPHLLSVFWSLSFGIGNQIRKHA